MDLARTNRAIQSLRPRAQFSIVEDLIIWQDPMQSQPSRSAIAGEMERLERLDAENAYKVARAAAYPEIGDQLDMLWHGMDSQEIPACSAFYNAIKAVKDANPKPK